MSLPLDEIRNIRFPMARKPQEDGYRASAVDNFIDRVEISYGKLLEDNESLRAQVVEGGVGADPAVAARIQELEAELNHTRDELESANQGKVALEGALAEVRSSGDSASGELAELREKLQGAENELAELRGEVVQARQESESAFGQLNVKNEELGAQAEELARLQAALADSSSRLDNLVSAQGDSDAQREAAWQELTNQVTELRAEVDRRTNELAAKDAELSDVQRELVAAQDALREVPVAASAAVAPVGLIDGVQRIEVTATPEASSAVISLVALATSQAETVLTEAKQESEQRRADAQRDADDMVNAARAAADALTRETDEESKKLLAIANETADRTTREAQQNADELTTRVAERQAELFAGLLADRDEFSAKIDQLKSYEANYRIEIQAHLRKLLERFGNMELAPKDRLTALEPTPITPRLDKLLSGE